MNAQRQNADYAGCAIPPEIYDIGFGWDPRPEIDRLLLLARQADVRPHSALELGCGTGRLLSALRQTVPDVCGIELSPAMVELGRARRGVQIVVGDMSDFALGRRFDLVFTSGNTIRHVLTDEDLARMWRRVRDHLLPGGVVIADLDLGFAAQAAKVGKPATWMISRDGCTVRVSWLVAEPPSPQTRCCTIEFSFESRGPRSPGKWQERFELRTYDAPEFLELALAGGGLEPRGIYEIRDPYLLERPPETATGRFLVVFQNPCGS